MLTSLETGVGLDVVLWLQAGGSSLLDLLAMALNAAGSEYVFMVVLSVIYWSVNRHLGLRMLFALMLAVVLNTALKLLFQAPRPFHVSDAVRMVVEAGSYGLPSNHVMSAVAIWGYLALYLRRRWVTIVVVIYVLLMAWARMYAGVHYPQDVVAGALLGALSLWLSFWLERHFPPFWSRLPLSAQVALVVLAGIVLTVFLFEDAFGAAIAGVVVGTGLGYMAEQRYVRFSSAGDTTQRVLRCVLGIMFVLAVFFGARVLFGLFADDGTTLENLLRVPRYALLSFAAMFVWPWLALRAGLIQAEDLSQPNAIPLQGKYQ